MGQHKRLMPYVTREDLNQSSIMQSDQSSHSLLCSFHTIGRYLPEVDRELPRRWADSFPTDGQIAPYTWTD